MAQNVKVTYNQVFKVVGEAVKKAIIGSYNWQGKVLKIGVNKELFYEGDEFEYKFVTDTVIDVNMGDHGKYLMIYNVPNEMLKIVPVEKKPKNMFRVNKDGFRMGDFLTSNTVNVTNVTQVMQQ